jgi:hypothetical protein
MLLLYTLVIYNTVITVELQQLLVLLAAAQQAAHVAAVLHSLKPAASG